MENNYEEISINDYFDDSLGLTKILKNKNDSELLTNIKNLITEIYDNKNTTEVNKKRLILNLSSYMAHKYYNVNLRKVVFVKSDDFVAKSCGDWICFDLFKMESSFNNNKNLLDLIWLVGHELGHSYNYQNEDIWFDYKNFENIIYLLNTKNITDYYVEPNYTSLIMEKDRYLSNDENYYKSTYDYNFDEHLASYNSIMVTEDILRDLGLFSSFEEDIKKCYQKFTNLLQIKYRKKDDVNSNIDLIFDKSNMKSCGLCSPLIKREYNKDLTRKRTSQLLLELYKIIFVLENKKMSFKKYDILDKRKQFYLDLILKRDMDFNERVADIQDLIKYNPILINIDSLKLSIIQDLLEHKVSECNLYNSEQINFINQLLMDYIEKYDNKNRKIS